MKMWTKEEDAELLEYFEVLGKDIIIPGRTSVAITQRASKLGLINPYNRTISTVEYSALLSKLGLEVLEEYKGSKVKVLHRCVRCSNTWYKEPIEYTRSRPTGCPICHKGFGSRQKTVLPENAYVYCIEIVSDIETFIKIGVTLREISVRIKELEYKLNKAYSTSSIKVLGHLYNTGTYALELEHSILSDFPRYYTMKEFSGHTECLPIECTSEVLKRFV